ncbi:hypothetical protein GQ600_1688 [Phytophthora cactorum]|nr:hypothetical protein GQ600_1688 [Phytophthora cactorum]
MLSPMSSAICALLFDNPFNSTTDDDDDATDVILGPSLMVREQRARAAHLYKSVVSWSLWYAHRTSMPEGGWVADVDKCVCGCKIFNKHKTCCHVIVGRKAKKLGKPGSEDVTAKLFNRRPLLASRALSVQFIRCPDT